MIKNNSYVLVTGGAGYIGSHACKSLAKNGYIPVTYDNLINGNKNAVKWGPFEKGDILDSSKLIKVINKYKPVAIMHFAAHIAAGESVTDPGKYYRNNTMGGLSVIEAAVACGIKHIIFSSTAAVYGISEINPITEDLSTQPINPYGYSKLMVEKMLESFSTAYGITYSILRYFNAAGADPEGEIGCYHKQPSNLIPVIMEILAGKREYLEIFGTDYNTQDGTAIRDYIHVSDLASAHVLALKHLLSGGTNILVNLGTGQGYSVKEVVTSSTKVSGKQVPMKNTSRRAGDPPILVSNANKAYDILGWKAEYTNIDDITSTAWQWQKKIA